jgi:hypothetical protein
MQVLLMVGPASFPPVSLTVAAILGTSKSLIQAGFAGGVADDGEGLALDLPSPPEYRIDPYTYL